MGYTNDELRHFGVLGMRWGRRSGVKTGVSPPKPKASDDHLAVAAIQKKPLRRMTDDEIRTLVKRKKLVREFKSVSRNRAMFTNTKIMSNSDLIKATNRAKLKNAEFRIGGVPRKKEIKAMTDDEVSSMLSRYALVKQYKDLRMKELEPAKKLLMYLLKDK